MNAFPEILGFHYGGGGRMSVGEMGTILSLSKVIQFIGSNPRRYSDPNLASVEMYVEMEKQGLYKPIIHSPYLVNFIRPNKVTVAYSLKYIAMLFQYLQEKAPESKLIYVTHTGKATENRDEDLATLKYSVMYMRDMLASVGVTNYSIALETDPGGKGRSDASNIFNLAEILKEVNDSRIGICYDTEHSYCSGVDISKGFSEEIWDMVKVVHLNAIPPEVKFGGHLDRHSFTRLSECSIQASYLDEVMGQCIKRSLPIVLERRDLTIIEDDIKFISNKYGTRI